MSNDVLPESTPLLATLVFDVSTKLTHEPLDTGIDFAGDLQTIDKWDEIFNGHHNEKRRVERHKYRSWVRLAFMLSSVVDKTEIQQMVIINACSRDISTHGAGILCPEEVFPRRWDDSAETIKTRTCLSVSDSVALGLQRAEGNWITMKSEIRSLRKTRNGLNHIGLKFGSSAK